MARIKNMGTAKMKFGEGIIVSGSSGDTEPAVIISGSVLINPDQRSDCDFRIESDGDTHAFFVDSGTNNVGVGTSSPAEKLDVVTESSSNSAIQFNVVNTNAHATNGSAGISATLYQDNASPVVASKILTVKGAATWDAGDNPAAAMEFWLRSAADQALNKIMTLTSNGGMRFGTDWDTGSSGAVLFQQAAPIFRLDSTTASSKPSFQMHRGATNTHGETGTGLLDGTALGGMQWFGTDTTDYVQGGAILAMADGSWSASGHPLKLIFNISGNTGTAVTMMVLEGSTGRLGLKPSGAPNPLYPLHLEANAAGWAMGIENDGNDSGRYGLRIQCGTDDNSSTNYAIQIKDGDGTAQGNVTFSGGTVTYGAFTGDHYVSLSNNATDYEYGTVMKTISTNETNALKTVSYTCSPTISSKDKAVLGVYSSNFRNSDEESMQDLHSIFALGDGHILVCNAGGNIEIGDYICSSDIIGHGMKQDDDLLHNYTIAKSSEIVNWSNEPSNVKLIACTYHCG